MSPPDATTSTNAEDEIRALRPVAIIPVVENVESEDESSADENINEEVPPEGEPLGEEPVEAPPVEETEDDTEEYEEVSDSSAASLTSPTTPPASPQVGQDNPPPVSPVTRIEPSNTFHMGESSRGTVRPRLDDSYPNFIPRQRISDPYHMTIPQDDTSVLYSLSGGPYFPPTPPTNPPHNPDFNLQMYRQLQTVQNRQQVILDRLDYVERMTVYDAERNNLRMDGIEIELMRLRSTVRGLDARLSRLEDASFRRRM